MQALTHTSQITPVSASLFTIPGCHFEKTFLSLDDDIEFDHWERIGQILQTVGQAVQWWIGDWLNFGERKYGEKYAQAIESTGYAYDTLSQMANVAKDFEFRERSRNLSWTHHLAVVGLPRDDRAELLGKAEAEHWSSREIKKRAYARKTYKAMEAGADPVWTANQAKVEQWLLIRDSLRNFAEGDQYITRVTNGYIEEIESRLKAVATKDFKSAILYAIREGFATIEALADVTKKEKQAIKYALEDLLKEGKIRTEKQGKITDVARGATHTLYLVNHPPDSEGHLDEEDDDLDEN